MPRMKYLRRRQEDEEEVPLRNMLPFRILFVSLVTAIVVFQLSHTALLKETLSLLMARSTTTVSSPQSTTTQSFDPAPLSPLHQHDKDNHNCPSPSLANRGGVFVFFHLAKAGGTTVRHLFEKQVSNRVVYQRISPLYADTHARHWLTNTTEHRTLFLELHDKGDPSLSKLVGYLNDWRLLSALHHKPLFVFTIVRDPVKYALSFFTFMNVGRRHMKRYSHWDGTVRTAELTTQDLLEFQLPSPQCLFYARGELATTSEHLVYGSKFDPSVECPLVYDQMTQYMDWIGTVETMQDELLPLLTYLTDDDPAIGAGFQKANAQSTLSKMGRFAKEAKENQETMAALKPKIAADQLLYDRVKQDYRFDAFWSKCLGRNSSSSSAAAGVGR